MPFHTFKYKVQNKRYPTNEAKNRRNKSKTEKVLKIKRTTVLELARHNT